MTRVSFTLKSNVLDGSASTTGSFVQAGSDNINLNDGSALKSDGLEPIIVVPPVIVEPPPVITPTPVDPTPTPPPTPVPVVPPPVIVVPPPVIVIPPIETPDSTQIGYASSGMASYLATMASDYNAVSLEWGINSLVTTVTATPAITALKIYWSLIGPPETLPEGMELPIQITASNRSDSYSHTGLPSGKWVYYTVFAKYESTNYHSWYEKVVSTEVLVPKDYGYTENLFRRIPYYYRLQDEQTGLTNLLSPNFLNLPESLRVAGPLQRMLDVFGWESNVIRTIIDYVITQKDPFVANSEMIEQLAAEIGVPLKLADLGTAKLRELITDFTYLTQNEGLLTGVQEYITAIAGCNTVVNTDQADLLSATHHAMSSVLLSTSASAVPATNQWLLESSASAYTMTAASVYPYSNMFTTTKALAITRTSGSGVQMACLKTKVQNASQASRLYMDFGATYTNSGASVVGCWLGASVQAASAVAYAPSTGASTTLDNFVAVETNGVTSNFEWPITFGVCGNGGLSTTDMYLHIWVASQSANTGILYLIPNKITTLNRYPYYIDVYSRRLNLVRDPQFTITPSTSSQATSTGAYWRVSTTTGSVSVAVASKVFTATPSASASVTLSTDVTNSSGGMQYTPISSSNSYFLSIDDYNNNIVKVSIKNLDGSITIASATTPYSTNNEGGYTRKYWKLEPPTGYPWYPINSNKYHLEITASVTTTNVLKVSRPLLEPFTYNEYFDGNSDDGGWIGGLDSISEGADYRWGGNIAHTRFSYYTADYRRTVEATKRLIPNIVPVTETTYALANLRFDRIPGYTESGQP